MKADVENDLTRLRLEHQEAKDQIGELQYVILYTYIYAYIQAINSPQLTINIFIYCHTGTPARRAKMGC